MAIAVPAQDALTESRKTEFVLFLLGYFLSRIVWGGSNEGFSLDLGILQMAIAAYAVLKFPPSSVRMVAGSTVFLLLFLIETGFFLSWRNTPGSEAEYLIASIRLWGYLFGITLYALTIRRQDIEPLCEAFIELAVYSIAVAVICTFLYGATGIGLLMNFYGGKSDVVRPQAFFSEPSGFAPVVAAVLMVGYQKRRAGLFMWGLVGMAITQSPIVILTALLTGLFFILARGSIVVRGLFIVALFSAAYVSMKVDCASMIQGSDPLTITAGRMACGAQSFFDDGMTSQNGRLVSTFAALDVLEQQDAWWRGFGLNSSSVFMGYLFNGVHENSFWLSILLFYGILGVAACAALCMFALFRIQRAPIELAAIFVALLVAASINSAQGFYLYGMFIFALIVLAFRPAVGKPTSGQRSFDKG